MIRTAIILMATANADQPHYQDGLLAQLFQNDNIDSINFEPISKIFENNLEDIRNGKPPAPLVPIKEQSRPKQSDSEALFQAHTAMAMEASKRSAPNHEFDEKSTEAEPRISQDIFGGTGLQQQPEVQREIQSTQPESSLEQAREEEKAESPPARTSGRRKRALSRRGSRSGNSSPREGSSSRSQPNYDHIQDLGKIEYRVRVEHGSNALFRHKPTGSAFRAEINLMNGDIYWHVRLDDPIDGKVEYSFGVDHLVEIEDDYRFRAWSTQNVLADDRLFTGIARQQERICRRVTNGCSDRTDLRASEATRALDGMQSYEYKVRVSVKNHNRGTPAPCPSGSTGTLVSIRSHDATFGSDGEQVQGYLWVVELDADNTRTHIFLARDLKAIAPVHLD